MKSLRFIGSARKDLSAFSDAVKLRAGHELFMVQVGRDPDDWKPMPSIGPGTREIRVRERSGQFRVIYVASFEAAIYVLHAFQKKTQKTSAEDRRLAKRRYQEAKAIDEE